MASKRKSSDSDFVPQPKRTIQQKIAGGKNRSAPIDVEAISPGHRKTAPAKVGLRKTRTFDLAAVRSGGGETMTVFGKKMAFTTKRRYVLTKREDGEGFYLKRTVCDRRRTSWA